MKNAAKANQYRLTATILKNLAKPRPVRTEAEVFKGLSDETEAVVMDRSDLIDLLTRVSEYLDQRADVQDGEVGEILPNKAMSLGMDVDAAIARLEASDVR